MLTQQIRAFKEKIKNEPVIGPFSKTEDPAIIEAMGYAGMDFVILDLEHGPNTVSSLQHLICAAEISNILPIVRVKENAPHLIGEVLDIGAGGIQIPQIKNAEDVHEVMKYAKFAPEGMRGVCRYVRAANYSSMDRFQYFKESNEAVIVLQLEGQEALDNINDIIEIEGFDILFIGPYDLSQSLGFVGQTDHPLVKEMMAGIVKKCQQKSISVGTFVDTIEQAKYWKQLGIRYICYSVDVGIFYEKCREIIDDIMQQ